MPTIQKSQITAASEIIANYTATDPAGNSAATDPGTVNRDIIDSVADLTSQTFTAVETTREMASLQNANLITQAAMSQIGLNFDMVQLQPTIATGTVYFQKYTPVTKIIDFPVGTVVQTQMGLDGSVTKFVTTTAAQLNPQTQLNPANYRYEAAASVVALLVGSAGNVGPGAINQLATPNRNIDGVLNKAATTGGSDIEGNVAFATRILAKTAGTTLGTAPGTASAILTTFPDVTEVAIAGPNDPAMKRKQFGNEVDVYLLGSSTFVFTNLITVSGTSTDLLSTHPAIGLTSVVGATTGTTFVVGTDVTLLRDTSPVFGGSVNAFDKLQWLNTHRPGATQQVNATGTYDADVVAVQNYLNLPTTRFVTENILAKSATRVGVVVQAQVAAFSGFDRTALAATVQTAVINGISNYALGQSVIQSDVVDIIAAVPGVNEVQIPLTALYPTGTPIPIVNDEIVVLKNAYARTDSVVITTV